MKKAKAGRPKIEASELKQVTPFRLNAHDLKLLAELTTIHGGNKSEALRAAIHDAHAMAKKRSPELFDTKPQKKASRLQPTGRMK